MKPRMLEALQEAGAADGRQPAIGRRWMVATPNAWATTVGAALLEDGASAVDAALAVSAALTVAVPHQTSPGGDAFWLIEEPGAAPVAVNASGRSAAATDADALRARGLPRIPERSGAAVTVPGLVAGWHAVADRYARRSLSALVEPAVSAARRGLPATPYLVRQLTDADSLLAQRPESDRVFRPGGRTLRVGEPLVLDDLARTIESAAQDSATFYRGGTAQAISAAVRDDGGFLAPEDLARHVAHDAGAPIEALVRAVPHERGPDGWRLCELGPNSQGWLTHVLLGLWARLAEGQPRQRQAAAGVTAAQAAMVLRSAVLSDPAAAPAPASTWLDDGYLDRVAGALGGPWPLAAAHLARAMDVPLTLDGPSRGDTAHFAVVDAAGTAVSCIQSLFFDFGSGIVPKGLGFALQNRGAGFTLRAGHPNRLRPLARPAHTLAPALATDAAGDVVAVLGCMGGDAQTQIHAQLLDALQDDPDPARATAMPRWFTRPAAGALEVLVEGRGGLGARLEQAGHRPIRVRPFDERMGHAQLILRLPGGALVGSADPRSDGLALGG